MQEENPTIIFEIGNINGFNQEVTEYTEKAKIIENLDNGNFYDIYYLKEIRKPDEMYKEYNAEYYETGELPKAVGLAGFFESQLN